MVVDKKKVALRFGQNVSTYNQEAFIQKEITEELYQKITSMDEYFENCFEIGCGSGFLTKKLQNHIHHSYAVNDLDTSCTHQLLKENKLTFFGGDAEKISFPKNNSIVVSTSAFQWMQNISKLFRKINDSLSDNGVLAFSTFGLENFRQIKGILNEGLTYYSIDFWKEHLEKEGFDILSAWEWKKDCSFKDGTAVLKHIKKTGVSGSNSSSKIWNKKTLQAFNEEYTQYFSTELNEVSLTYHPLFFIAKKK
ncbi:malonyl-ACP O-methyltransferase BioC [Flammeovirga kamogawensis]|uniref:Malonyl-[acyl-carrier protein] O-methyltransferase n=1 Tax=Flammeovirga kamogawensis TaxID=373891 RepID=A0ABX8GXB5_9BACT|nr:malonyl-ACP O-methyltransferase BioC [Flammeovirga kamogawensis]MBB6461009.1 malonyl-CoA O-methyltransferase [Flammeovirga kamogawensis]QWG07580.1 malonyl-ACP O-methyltransferase BioC [Flammeovirga kamogawensis]TRX69392.1 malonyl-ACP O-methyltransferase BioC [Flammeovirga kamogawensis]